jgi:hypothetical protein
VVAILGGDYVAGRIPRAPATQAPAGTLAAETAGAEAPPLNNIPPKAGSSGGPGTGSRYIPESTKAAELADNPGLNCRFCGEPTTATRGPNQLNWDHADPYSRGGDTTPDNIQATCRTCNLLKGARTTQEFIQAIFEGIIGVFQG